MNASITKNRRPFWHWLIYIFSGILLMVPVFMLLLWLGLADPWNWGNKQKLEKKGQRVSTFSEGNKSVEAITKYAEGLDLKCRHIEARLSCSEIKNIPGELLSIYILVIEAETKDGKISSPMTYEIGRD